MDKTSIFDSVASRRVRTKDFDPLASTDNKKKVLEYQIYLQELQLGALKSELERLNNVIESRDKENADEFKRN